MQRKLYTLIITAVMIAVSLVGCAWGSVSLSAFPDPVFRERLKGYDYGWTEYDSEGRGHTVGNNDGILGDKEIERITVLAVRSSGIISLKGIEHLTALQTLDCFNNQLTALDVSNNTALTHLYCWDNQLTELDLSKNTALEGLYCWGQKRSGLNVKRTSEGYYE
ncbi:MAG: hypothetical protein IJQ24_08570, partial [Synergistaceae bacterium]|nr:hypothetical protein [Synergistaceae bacterium]